MSETERVLHVGDSFRYSTDDNANKMTDNMIDFFEQEASNDKNSNEARSRFLNLLLKNSLPDTEKILGHKDFARIQNEKAASMIEEHLMDLISIKRGKLKPFPESRNKENTDLFLTANDKEFAETKAVNMVEDSLSNAFRDKNFAQKAKLLLENLSQMRNSLSHGKPILNFKPSVVQNHMSYLNLAEIPILKADDVLGGIKQGTFDIVTGNMRA